jgi:hypothetical protein
MFPVPRSSNDHFLRSIGSAAAAAHSWIGNIVAGSAISIGQSASVGGSGLLIVNGAAQLGGAAMTLGSASLAWVYNS